jgi:Cu(I)/Ag(I) efflux system membrane protein CusA/SilA
VITALLPVAHGQGEPQKLQQTPLAVPPLANQPRLTVADVARIVVAADMPTGVADYDGALATVGGIVVARRDADPKAIVTRVQRTLDELRPRLPASIKIETVYDRGDLADRMEHTLLGALGEEIIVVALIILIFLRHTRSVLVPLITLPTVVLMTFGAMRLAGLSATIMSLGGIGIALGMAVDADVVALEACHRHLEKIRARSSVALGRAERRDAIIAAAGTFTPAILTAMLITALSFLPVFAFGGETGRLLRPLALSKTFVLVAAALVTLTLAPALRDRLLVGKLSPEFANPLTKTLVRLYRPFVHFALSRPIFTLTTAALAVLSCLPIVTRLGGEFLPRVDEGDLLFMPTTLPGVAPGQAAVKLREMDRTIGSFNEVATVFGKVGRADTGTDPAPFSMAEATIRLRPRAEWPRPDKPMAELVEELDRATRLPGWTNAWTAPARARMDMMATGGVRVPVGIRIVAQSPERLALVGARLQAWATRLPGTRSAVFESLGGEPWLRFAPDAEALARHGVDPAVVRATVDVMTTGGQVGDIELARRLPRQNRPLRVRIATDMAMRPVDADLLREITVRPIAGGAPVPLALLGRPVYERVPAVLRNERGELVAYVYVDLDERTDVASYVRGAQAALDRALATASIQLEPGERIEWTGQYQLLMAGERRLCWIAPIVAIAMLLLLYFQFRSLAEALLVLVAVPFALVGSFWTLFLLRYPMSAPVWVGLFSAVGLAMQTGVVMVVYIDDAFHRRVRAGTLRDRRDIVEAHAEGTVQRLRPKIMTITTMAASLLPLLWAQGAGAEIMRRVAAPMIGGLLTSAFLTLEVLPVLYTIWRYRQLRQAARLGVPIEAVVGTVPAWARARG